MHSSTEMTRLPSLCPSSHPPRRGRGLPATSVTGLKNAARPVCLLLVCILARPDHRKAAGRLISLPSPLLRDPLASYFPSILPGDFSVFFRQHVVCFFSFLSQLATTFLHHPTGLAAYTHFWKLNSHFSASIIQQRIPSIWLTFWIALALVFYSNSSYRFPLVPIASQKPGLKNRKSSF